MEMSFRYFIFLFILPNPGSFQVQAQDYAQTTLDFFNAVRKNDRPEADKALYFLAFANEDSLKSQLDTENKAKAFWINVYNTLVQYLLKRNPELFEDRNDFFTTEYITVARNKLSLEDIEHGLIRRSRNKYGLGYLGSIFVSDFEEKFRLATIDYRIHFALNCGAKSCPPIAFYRADEIDSQLDKATATYLTRVAQYNAAENVIWAPAVCSWFKGDFGGEDGIIRMMKRYRVIPESETPDVEYLSYNWTLKLGNYINL
jgi:hypothetical protein